jgi:hypothetical protein
MKAAVFRARECACFILTTSEREKESVQLFSGAHFYIRRIYAHGQYIYFTPRKKGATTKGRAGFVLRMPFHVIPLAPSLFK